VKLFGVACGDLVDPDPLGHELFKVRNHLFTSGLREIRSTSGSIAKRCRHTKWVASGNSNVTKSTTGYDRVGQVSHASLVSQDEWINHRN
jgi:hypothetical protein